MIHPLADVKSLNIGEGTKIWQFSIVLEKAVIGKNCNINCHCFIENDVKIGDQVTIKSGVYLWDGIIIEDNVFIGPNATFVNNSYVRSKLYPQKHIGCFIEKGSSIGANATILSGIRIGKFGFVGAGSVVTKNVKPYSVVIGNPAIQIGFMTKTGKRLDMSLCDSKTGQKYRWDENNDLVRL